MADSTRPSEDAEAVSKQRSKDAKNKKRRERYAQNREQELLRMKQRRQEHPETLRAYDAANRSRHREKRNAKNREYMRLDRIKNPGKYKARAAAQRIKNPQPHRIRSARYYERHKEKACAASNRYKRRRRNEDSLYALLSRLRNRLASAMLASAAKKSASTIKLVGCSPEHLFKHIESQFFPGMSWENRSQWHIDHIVPVSKFDLSDPEQQAAAFHYTNLQPLWAKDNHRKSNKVPGQHLFGFAYAARIAEGDQPRLSGRARNGTRQHSTNQRR